MPFNRSYGKLREKKSRGLNFVTSKSSWSVPSTIRWCKGKSCFICGAMSRQSYWAMSRGQQQSLTHSTQCYENTVLKTIPSL